MGRGIEFLLLPLAAMLLLSIAAVLAGFFNRSAAKGCAIFAAVLAALFLLIVCNLNGWSVKSVVDAVFRVPGLFAVVAASVLLSAVALWAPLRRRVAAPRAGAPVTEQPRWGLFVVTGLVVAGALGAGIWSIVSRAEESHVAEAKTRRLLEGRSDVRLQSVALEHQQRRVKCTDPEVLRYLEARFRASVTEPKWDHGWSYEMTLTYERGGTGDFSTDWLDGGGFNLYIGEPGEGGDRYGIVLARPRPRGVDELVDFLEKPHREAAGKVMILEAGGSRLERDESLLR